MRPRIEHKKLVSVARQFRDLGYQVQADLGGYEQPQHLGPYAPDLIAQKGNEMIVVQIVSRPSMKDSQDAINHFATLAKGDKNVRFNLIVTNPRPSRAKVLMKEVHLLRQLENAIVHALEITKEDQPVTFLVLCGILTEHIVRTLSNRPDKDQTIMQQNTLTLAKNLQAKDIISDSAFEFMRQVLSLRDAALQDSIAIKGTQLADIRHKLKSLIRNYPRGTRSVAE